MYASKNDLMEYALKKGYDMNNFESYLMYQLLNKPSLVRCMEEYAINKPEANLDLELERKYYYLSIGYTTDDNVPDYCSFYKYCESRNLNINAGKSYQIK